MDTGYLQAWMCHRACVVASDRGVVKCGAPMEYLLMLGLATENGLSELEVSHWRQY